VDVSVAGRQNEHEDCMWEERKLGVEMQCSLMLTSTGRGASFVVTPNENETGKSHVSVFYKQK
jgi:hypothetical protein